MRNIDCEKYLECLDRAAKKDINLICEECKSMGNYLKPEKKEEIIRLIEKGESDRKIHEKTGSGKGTVSKIRKEVFADKIDKKEPLPTCECGEASGHKGWCFVRLKESPKRQKMIESWHEKRVDTPLEKLLLSKFPSFDPVWTSEVQVKWFDGFNKLLDYLLYELYDFHVSKGLTPPQNPPETPRNREDGAAPVAETSLRMSKYRR